MKCTKTISSNLKSNSCYFNVLISTDKESIKGGCENDRRYCKDLTTDRLCEILGIGNKEQDLGLSIMASVRSFKKLNLNLIAAMEVMLEWDVCWQRTYF